MYPTPDQLWDIILNGVTDADIQSYIDDNNLTPEVPTDAATLKSLTEAKTQAAAKGNSGFEKILDKILTYGDKILTILSKNGIINTNALNTAGLTYVPATVDKDATNEAPDAKNRVFGIDFTDPKVLIITFLLLMILFYFLFFNSSKNGKSKR